MNLNEPIAYFITFRGYGTWLHGSEKGSVDAERNQYGAALIPANSKFEEQRRKSMRQAEMTFTEEQRQVIKDTIREVCEHRGWSMRGVNVRTNHVHVVVAGWASPEKMLGDFKRYATRRLRERGLVDADRLVWSEHGSTKYLWDEDDLFEAWDYAMNRQ